jgi:hypothetical protein
MSYDPDWKMRYVELKGWDNMSEGEKYLVTHTCSSSAMGMGMKSMQEELKRMTNKDSQYGGNIPPI